MPRSSHFLTLSQAAKATGKSKSVISKALADSRLSYMEKDASGYKIDPAELFRVFEPKSADEPQNDNDEGSGTGQNTKKNDSQSNALRMENNLLSERLKDKEERISELKDERERLIGEKDHWRHQAERLLITYQPGQSTSAPKQAATTQEAPSRNHTTLIWGAGGLILLAVLFGFLLNQPEQAIDQPSPSNPVYEEPAMPEASTERFTPMPQDNDYTAPLAP